MNAPRRNAEVIGLPFDAPEWKPWRAETIRRIRDTAGTETYLESLVEGGCDREELLFRLAAIVAWRGKKTHWKTTGLSRHLLMQAPKKLRDTAKLIELYQSVFAIHLEGQPAPSDIGRALYALAGELAELNRLLLHPSKLTWEVSAICSLVGYVKRATGAHHDEKVSGLIDAVTGKAPFMGTPLAQWRSKHKEDIELMGFGVVNPLLVPVPRT